LLGIRFLKLTLWLSLACLLLVLVVRRLGEQREDNLLAFEGRIDDGSSEIFIHDFSVDRTLNVTNSPFDELLPTWTPEGKLSYSVAHEWGSRVNIIPYLGDSPVPVVTDSTWYEVLQVWSARGHMALTATDNVGDTEIYIVYPGESAWVNITNRPGPEFLPAWSPDSSRLVYILAEVEDSRLMLYDLQTQDTTTLVDGAATSVASWSDNDHLVFTMPAAEGLLYEYDLRTGELSVLTDYIVYQPRASLDGRVAFVSNIDGWPDLYVLNRSTGHVTRLTDGLYGVSYPAWQR
jgi:hypothetical protein